MEGEPTMGYSSTATSTGIISGIGGGCGDVLGFISRGWLLEPLFGIYFKRKDVGVVGTVCHAPL